MSNRVSSTCRPLLVLFIGLILVSPHIAKAAQNSNSTTNANTNTTNVNAGANTNTNVNATSNTNTSTNQNQNANDGKGGADQNAAKTTPSPVDIRTKLLDSSWYPLVVSLLFGALVLGFAGTIARVILRSKSSFRSPLGLPEGSLRAMLAFLLVTFLGFYVYASVLSLSMEFQMPDALLGIIATVIGFYFGSRSVEGAGAGAKTQTGSVDGSVVDSSGTPASGATIDLSQGGVKKLTQTSDLKGKFKFDDVPIGEYEIQASLATHTPSDAAKIKVTAGGTQTVNLKLK